LILIAVLVVTRVRFLPLRAWLNAESPALPLNLGSLGTFSVSVALVFRLESIFGTSSAWSYNALFVPALIRMALPESLTSDSQPPFCHSSWLHEPRVLLAPTLTSSGLDAAWPVVDLMSANRDEEPFV